MGTTTSTEGNVDHRSTGMEKLPKTNEEIAQLIIAELRSFDCKNVLDVVTVPIVDHADVTTWTVSCFNVGNLDGARNWRARVCGGAPPRAAVIPRDDQVSLRRGPRSLLMRIIIFIAAAASAGSLAMTPAHTVPANPSGIQTEVLVGSEAVHCTPGKNHHFPTWNYQRDGCRRGPRKNGRPKKAQPET